MRTWSENIVAAVTIAAFVAFIIASAITGPRALHPWTFYLAVGSAACVAVALGRAWSRPTTRVDHLCAAAYWTIVALGMTSAYRFPVWAQ